MGIWPISCGDKEQLNLSWINSNSKESHKSCVPLIQFQTSDHNIVDVIQKLQAELSHCHSQILCLQLHRFRLLLDPLMPSSLNIQNAREVPTYFLKRAFDPRNLYAVTPALIQDFKRLIH